LFSRIKSISELTSTGSKLSERANRLISTKTNKLEMTELAYLIREHIGVSICIIISIQKLKEMEIRISMLHRDDKAEKQRELIRELVLLNNYHWDINSNEHKQFKKLLGIKIDYLSLPKTVKDDFKKHEPKELVWNEKSIQNFKSYMNDSRMGVICGYGMVTSLKRTILNGNSIMYQIAGESIRIQDKNEFKKLIVDKLECNDELLELLNKENEMKK
jgi:hypothetical protein